MSEATVTVWHRGWTGSPQEIDAAVAAFRLTAAPDAGWVAPWDRPIGPDTLDAAVPETLWGVLLTPIAECRWRCEGDRALASVVSVATLEGLDLQAEDLVAEDTGQGRLVAMLRPPALRPPTSGDPRIRHVTYRRGGLAWLTRTIAEI